MREQMQQSSEQTQTEEAFGFKWAKRDTYESKALAEKHSKWMLERYCKNDPEQIERWLAGGPKRILDAGCGAGWSGLIFFGDYLSNHKYIGADISSAVDVAKQRFEERGLTGEFIQASLFDLPIESDSLDMIFSEGVLHHTDSTKDAIAALTTKLKPGGRFLFYVYAKKGPIREFADDYIRDALQPLSDEQAWEAMKPLTLLGKSLGDLDATVDVPEDIPFLGIKKGPINVQRLFYWHVAKMFHSPELSVDELNHINFDWYRPLNCHRQTPEEVEAYCAEAGLAIEHMDVQEAGISVVAQKR
jgi:arsenite methyltransferase